NPRKAASATPRPLPIRPGLGTEGHVEPRVTKEGSCLASTAKPWPRPPQQEDERRGSDRAGPERGFGSGAPSRRAQKSRSAILREDCEPRCVWQRTSAGSCSWTRFERQPWSTCGSTTRFHC
ncbi:hypothetical protein Z043_106492, partial [Scleropages formosus]